MTTPTRQTAQIWICDRDPQEKEYPPASAPVETSNFFLNESLGKLWRCVDGSDQDHLVWQRLNQQADWEQEDEDALDFIKNKPTIPSISSPEQSPETRPINSTAFQISETRWAHVNYSVKIACTSTLLAAQEGKVSLEICPDDSFESGVQLISQIGYKISGVAETSSEISNLNGFVPAGFYTRLKKEDISGTPTYTYICGQETLLF